MKLLFKRLFLIQFCLSLVSNCFCKDFYAADPEGTKLSEWIPTSEESYYLLHQNIDQIALAQNPRFCLNVIPRSTNPEEQVPFVDYTSEHCYKFEVKENGWIDLTTILLPLSSQTIEDINLACQFIFGSKAKALYYRNKIIPKPVSKVYSLKKENISNLYQDKDDKFEVMINNLHLKQSKQIHSLICSNYNSKFIPHYLGRSPERKFAWAPIKHSDELKFIIEKESEKLKNQFKKISQDSFFPKQFELKKLKELKSVLIYLDASSTLQRILFNNQKGLDLALSSLKSFLELLPAETKITIIITPVIWDQKSKHGYSYLKRMNNVSLEDAMKLTNIKNWVSMKENKKFLTPYPELPYLTIDKDPIFSNKMVGTFKTSNDFDFGIFIGDGEHWSRGANGKPGTNTINDEVSFIKKISFPFTFVRVGNKKEYNSYFNNVPRDGDKVIQGKTGLDPLIYLELKKMKEVLSLSNF